MLETGVTWSVRELRRINGKGRSTVVGGEVLNGGKPLLIGT